MNLRPLFGGTAMPKSRSCKQAPNFSRTGVLRPASVLLGAHSINSCTRRLTKGPVVLLHLCISCGHLVSLCVWALCVVLHIEMLIVLSNN